jgi:hypothetical protein
MEIRIDRPVVNPTSSYELILEYTHGDGDGLSERNFMYDESALDTLKRDLTVLNMMIESEDTDEYDDIAYKNNAPSVLGFLTYDITNHDYYAFIDNMTVLYYDENGVQHFTSLLF